MASKAQLVAVTLCLLFVTVGLLSLTSSSGGATEDFDSEEVHRQILPVLPSPAPFAGPGVRWDVEKWDEVGQLPIRQENPMYVPRDGSWEERVRLRKVTLEMKSWEDPEVQNRVFDRFYPLIGGNGLIEVLDYVLTNDHSKFGPHAAHHLGEYLYDKAGGRWEDLGEIVSRNLLKKAPLHGALWSLVAEHGVGDVEEFHHFVENLCWYQDMPGMLPVWISCVHGVGHGLSMLYGEDVDAALDVCAQSHSADFQYSCATGIYMDQDSRQGWAPCDVSRFPAACFRFKSSELGQLRAANVARPCDQFESRYHKMGCIWARGFLMSSHEALERCKKTYHRDKHAEYSDWQLDQYMACLSGAWESSRLTKLDPSDSKKLCHSFKERSIVDFCMSHTVVVPGDEEARWDGSLLEKYFDPYAPAVEVPFPFPP